MVDCRSTSKLQPRLVSPKSKSSPCHTEPAPLRQETSEPIQPEVLTSGEFANRVKFDEAVKKTPTGAILQSCRPRRPRRGNAINGEQQIDNARPFWRAISARSSTVNWNAATVLASAHTRLAPRAHKHARRSKTNPDRSGAAGVTLAAARANRASLCGRALARFFRLCVAFGVIVLTMGTLHAASVVRRASPACRVDRPAASAILLDSASQNAARPLSPLRRRLDTTSFLHRRRRTPCRNGSSRRRSTDQPSATIKGWRDRTRRSSGFDTLQTKKSQCLSPSLPSFC